MKKIIAVALCIIMMVSMMSFNFAVSAEEYGLMSDVYVSPSGTDRATGLENDPCTLARAYVLVKDGGTIHIDGTIVVPADFSFNKNVTIVGDDAATDVLDLSAMPEGINLGGDISFDYVTFKTSGYNIIAAYGHTLLIGENCATDGSIGIYGGGYKITTVGDTNVTVLSGAYAEIYGGGHLGAIIGDTHVTVAGTASVFRAGNIRYNIYGAGYGSSVEGSTYVLVGGNANRSSCSFTENSHDSNVHYVFGGGYNCDITGSTNVRVTDNATAHYIVGGMHGDPETFSGNIDNGSNVIIDSDGVRVYGIYGASLRNDQGSDANVIMTKGTVSQIIGASSGANHTGNVNVMILGGKVTRRIFGGSYNDWSFSWASSYYVDGLITLTIAEKANVQIDLNQSDDNAFTAHSRRSSVAQEEDGVVVFTSEEAKNDYLNAFNTGASIVGTGKPAYDSYSVKALLAGDANLDGEVTNADVLAVMQNIYSPEKYPLFVDSVADVNTDNDVTSVDLLIIYKMIYNAD